MPSDPIIFGRAASAPPAAREGSCRPALSHLVPAKPAAEQILGDVAQVVLVLEIGMSLFSPTPKISSSDKADHHP